MHRRLPRSVAACALILVAPISASAQSAAYYTPPKLKTQGKNTSDVAGPGTVVVKVLVTKTGSVTVQGIVRSSNHGDDAAALEIAKSSTYRPATRGNVALTAFYDYTLKFATKGGTASDTAAAGGLASFEREIRAGNYASAQTGLHSYAVAHPSDVKAELDLGIASALLSEATQAAAAFDKAGTIPDNYRALAAKAYNDAASAQIKAKDAPSAIAFAKRAIALAPNPFTYNTLGTGEAANGDYVAAIADLEKARALAAASANFKPADRATIDVNLVSAYLGASKPDDAAAVAAEATKLDPNVTNAQLFLANYYEKSASDLVTAGKINDAGVLYDKAAIVAPTQAVALYVKAAFVYLRETPNPDNVRAGAEADKALALAPNDAAANFAKGVALANQPGKTKDAMTYLTRADASAKSGSDASLTAAIEDGIKKLNGK